MQYAFVDESEPLGTGRGGPYVMVATVPLSDGDETLDGIREVLVSLKPKGAAKLHWYENVDALRDETIQTIGGLPLMHVAVIVRPVEGDRPERTRRACLERVLWELQQLEIVTHVVFESRGPVADRRDMQMVQALRAARTISSRMRIDHMKGASEPLLWVPDAVCGAVGGQLVGQDIWAVRLDHQLRIVT